MTRSDLIAKLAPLYQESYDRLVNTRKSIKLDAVSRAIGKATVLLECLSEDVSVSVNEKLLAAIEEVKSHKPVVPDREGTTNKLTIEYQNFVNEFTAAGGVGYYDIGATLWCTYDRDLPALKAALASLSSKHDIHVFYEGVQGNPTGNPHLMSAQFGIVLPSSLLREFKEAISGLINHKAMYEMQHTVHCEYSFLSPVLNDLNETHLDQIAFLKETHKKYADGANPSWAVESAFGLLGCARYALGSNFTADNGISRSFLAVELFNQHENEFCNGVMPTGFYYSHDEIERFGLDASGFDLCEDGKPSKIVNMVDELVIYKKLSSEAASMDSYML